MAAGCLGERHGPKSSSLPVSCLSKSIDFSISSCVLHLQEKGEDNLLSLKCLSTFIMAGFYIEELAITSPLHHIHLSSIPPFAPQPSAFIVFHHFSAVTAPSLFLPLPCTPKPFQTCHLLSNAAAAGGYKPQHRWSSLYLKCASFLSYPAHFGLQWFSLQQLSACWSPNSSTLE